MRTITKQKSIDLMKQGGYLENMGYYSWGKMVNRYMIFMPDNSRYHVRPQTALSVMRTEGIYKEKDPETGHYTRVRLATP